MGRVIHFQIHSDNTEASIAFYEGLFGWEFRLWDGPLEYWNIITGEASEEGIDGGMIRRQGPAPTDGQPVNAYACTVDVADIDSTLEKAVALGAKLAVPKMEVQGVGWLAYLTTPEGNILGVMECFPEAHSA